MNAFSSRMISSDALFRIFGIGKKTPRIETLDEAGRLRVARKRRIFFGAAYAPGSAVLEGNPPSLPHRM
jgi:hypothetical protein